MSDSLKNIELDTLDNVTGGLLGSTPTRRYSSSSGSSTQLQTALTGVTSALDSLKQNQNNTGVNQLLPVVLMAKWMRQN